MIHKSDFIVSLKRILFKNIKMKRSEGTGMYHFSLDRFDNEAYVSNPLLKFRLSAIRRRQHNASMKRKAARVRIRTSPIFASRPSAE